MAISSAAKKTGKQMPKGYSLHEPTKSGAVPKEVIQQRFAKLEALLAIAKKSKLQASK